MIQYIVLKPEAYLAGIFLEPCSISFLLPPFSSLFLQGPLPNTGCHFWLMVWQQKTKAIVMLNRVVEKESVSNT